MVKLTQEQAAQIADFGRNLTLKAAEDATEFCEQAGFNTGTAFETTLRAILVSFIFITLEGLFDDPGRRRKVADEIHADVKKLLREHAIREQVQKIRNQGRRRAE